MLVDITYALYVITFLTGLLFFIRFDARRRPLRRRLLGIHLIMAVVTFIMVTSIVATRAWGPPPDQAAPPKNPKQSTMWDYLYQHRSELNHHHAQGPLQNGGRHG
jgi:amino acid transporter